MMRNFKKTMKTIVILFIFFLPTIAMSSQEELCGNRPSVQHLSVNKAASIIEKEPRYTQGFLFQNGLLYESSGLYGKSALHEIDLKTKKKQTAL